ncbi:uncharacterized protein LOC101848502 [Aplysia californica]|uniref:Uncharacterized protein LOC101848502 n=1 Tax=Aplysia californica TaxID=6500 RepID=A0ABM0JHE6_APLCA|nr:uncharacterized protein LOC101848502 [Aplysia californica]
MAPRGGKRENVLEADISFDLQRLFDPYNFDHIPVDQRLSLFKQRDLPHVRHYKAAVKIFGGPHRRTRAIVAPPMETPLKHRLGVYHNVFQPPGPPALNGPLRPQPEPVKEPTTEEKALMVEEEKVSKYKSWINERKKLRGDLDNLGLNENFLARKPDKTELEKRVQAKYRRDRLWKPESPPPPEVPPEPTPLPDVPSVTVPPPNGLQILDKFLVLNRMRLMDLFRLADKDKSWTVSRAEFLSAVSQSEIPLTESEVDDIIITLDSNLDDELDYQEINKGLTQWRKNRRELKRQGLASESPVLGFEGKSKTPPVKDMKPPSRERDGRRTASREQNTEKGASVEKSSKSTPAQTPRERVSRESMKKPQSKEVLVRERTGSGKLKDTHSVDRSMSRERSNVSISKVSSKEDKSQMAGHDAEYSAPSSQQRVQLSDVLSSNLPLSRENQSVDKSNTADETLPVDSGLDRSVYEDVLFPSQDTPRATTTAEDIGEEEEGMKGKDKRSPSYAEGSRPESRRAGSTHSDSRSRSRTSTPNTLEPPDFDLRDETRAPESAEAMVDIRKHDRVVLSRSNLRRSLSREQKVMFDELPGVIKVGYKPIDDHCSESTLGSGVSDMVNQFRREKLKEYFEVKKLCEEKGLPFNHKTLDRVLLYPGDMPTNHLKKNIVLPLGPLTNEVSPFNQPKPKKKSKKRRRGMGRVSRASGLSGLSGAGSGGVPGGFAKSGDGAAGDDDGERSGSGSSKRSYVTVEDVYPFASSVAPKVYKENLSSGRALISRKVDNWMTFEEYSKYTENLPNRFRNLNRRSNPDAAWPGFLLDKLRLCMPPYDGNAFVDTYGRPILNRDSRAYEGHGVGLYSGKGHAVFRHTGQQKRAYPGYNNDLLTWPVGEHGVRYGNIDEHRLVH